MIFSTKLYTKRSIELQNILVSLHGFLKIGVINPAAVKSMLNELKQLEYDQERGRLIQKRQLFRILKHATKKIDFYRGKADSLNDIDQVENILKSEFLIINKQDIFSSPESFRYHNHFIPYVTKSTSGTTGSPLDIPHNLQVRWAERAFYLRQLEWAGIDIREPRVWLRGEEYTPACRKKSPFWRYSRFEDILYASTYHLSPQNIPSYLKAFNDFKATSISAFPSAIMEIAGYLQQRSQYYPGSLKAIFTSSEVLLDSHRQLIEDRFQCPVYDWYGNTEGVAAIGTCEHGKRHLLTDYSYVELIENDSGTHDIVGTTLHNTLYPLIRYNTGDKVVLSQQTSCSCGRHYLLIEKIEGRCSDYLVNEDGYKVTTLVDITVEIKGLKAAQFIQDEPNKIQVITVVEDSVFDKLQQDEITQNIRARLGESMAVEFYKVEKIPRTQSGKFRQAICSVEPI